jgi:hypothetical protein
MALALDALDSVGRTNITSVPSGLDAVTKGVSAGLALGEAEDLINERRERKSVVSNLPALAERVRQNGADLEAVAQLQKHAPKMVEYVDGLRKLDEETAKKRKEGLLENLAGAIAYVDAAPDRGADPQQAWEEVVNFNAAHNLDMGDFASMPWGDLTRNRMRSAVLGAKALMDGGGEWMAGNFTDAKGDVWGLTKDKGWRPIGAKGAPKEAEAPKTREFKKDVFVNGKKVSKVFTQEWDGATKKWTTIGEADRADPASKSDNFKDERDLRKEFNALNGAYREVEMAKGNVVTALAQNSAAGDLAASTAMMKMLDPGSVVRESELGMAMNATGAIDRVGNYAQMIKNGQRLNPTQRAEFTSLANALFSNADNTYQARKSDYSELAKEYGFKPENVIGRSAGPAKPSGQPMQETKAQYRAPTRIKNDADYAKLPSGAMYMSPDGKVRRKK